MSLELYNKCISIFMKFQILLSATTEIIEIREISAKFRRNFEPFSTSYS